MILSVIILYFSGFGMIAQFTATNTLLQHSVEDDKKGRVLSLYSMSFMGFTPIGSLLLGSLSAQIGVPLTLSISGVICLVSALLFSRKLPFIYQDLNKHKRI
jgi:MFS family permease